MRDRRNRAECALAPAYGPRGRWKSIVAAHWLRARYFIRLALMIFTGGSSIWPFIAPAPFVGESGEHAYRGTTTVFEATVSSLGLAQRLMFHPHGDGYHTVHHMWPGVPHFRIGRLHRVLIERDPEFAARLRFRTRVLEDVRTGFDRHRPR